MVALVDKEFFLTLQVPQFKELVEEEVAPSVAAPVEVPVQVVVVRVFREVMWMVILALI